MPSGGGERKRAVRYAGSDADKPPKERPAYARIHAPQNRRIRRRAEHTPHDRPVPNTDGRLAEAIPDDVRHRPSGAGILTATAAVPPQAGRAQNGARRNSFPARYGSRGTAYFGKRVWRCRIRDPGRGKAAEDHVCGGLPGISRRQRRAHEPRA